jgi:hypothetical protein
VVYLLDYSAKQLSGPIIKNAGYAGAVRYIDSTQGGKRITTAEYDSIVSSGLIIRMVMEVSTGDADGGYARGVSYAQRALAGANALGYGGVIYFCNDTPSLPSSTLWDDYLTGAASVLGWDRVGAYGFANAMDVAAQLTDCKHFWQAGRRSDVRPFVQLWQDNNTQVTVGGILCDRNLVLKDIGDDMFEQPDRDALYALGERLKAVFDLADKVSDTASPASVRGNKSEFVSGIKALAGRAEALVKNAPTVTYGPNAGETNKVNAKLMELEAKVDSLSVDEDAIANRVTAAVVAHLAANPPLAVVDTAAVAKAVNDDAAQRLAD